MRTFLKNPRIMILIFFVVLSIILIGPNPSPTGVKITYIGKDSPVTGLSTGNIIYKIDDIKATPDLLEKEYYGNIKLDTSRGIKYVEANGTLKIYAENAPMSNLAFGLDIKGGVRAIIEPKISDKATMDKTISTLQTRINIYGLRESNFRPITYEDRGFIEITMAGGGTEELKELLERQGKFEAKIPVAVRLDGNKGTLELDKKYEIIVEDNIIKIDGITVRTGENFTLAGIPFFVDNINNDAVNLTLTVYDGDDIVLIFFGKSRTRPAGGGYSWHLPIEISSEGAQKFAWITQNIPIAPLKPNETYHYLESKIYLYLDDELLDDLNIRSSLKGKVVKDISIEGWGSTMEQAMNAKLRLQSILESGALPTSIEVVQMDSISPKLGLSFLGIAAMAGFAAILAVAGVILIRYRKPKIVFPTIIISLSEVLIIVGVAAMIKWTIDLAAIAGIIAAVGTGVDSQIVILDQSLRGETESWALKERIGRAFFIIFGAGGTTIAAMLPMMILGFGLLRGFAIVTMIGVLAGILITRPAFGVIIERMTRK